ncbi:hypothetical protein QBC33DRAFT_530119 [Phialemonium atrogriseum]|uniref:Uncharacterized protein n=1 Tax=Phialemonium atrogriseum TaxID=1093897 RepID=A0AAJ0C7D9_9PEZI|nr:uncharacterized protein QBC33DRAFT_530119 [Phialemonium atrogriseum]KAK1770092.1 hypothetical protein QBC33DRAFT_530119 [Phialemonium atrogriseum]
MSSNKITDARIEQLERLQKLKDELTQKLETEQDGMRALLNSMTSETQDSISSSSNTAKSGRRKKVSSLTHKDAIEGHGMAVQRLQEQFNKVDKELDDMKELMRK